MKDLGDAKELVPKWKKSGKAEGQNRHWVLQHVGKKEEE